MFASRTLSEHLVRGVLGLGAVALAMSAPVAELPAWLDLFGRVALAIGALVLLRGCPMCWLYGLLETVITRVTGRPVRSWCEDGMCARRGAAMSERRARR